MLASAALAVVLWNGWVAAAVGLPSADSVVGILALLGVLSLVGRLVGGPLVLAAFVLPIAGVPEVTIGSTVFDSAQLVLLGVFSLAAGQLLVGGEPAADPDSQAAAVR